MRKIIAGLDIGSHTLKLVIGEMFHGKLNILACVDIPSRGVKKGFIVNVESAKEALKELFKKGEEQIGLPIKHVCVNVPSNGAECFLTEGYASITNDERIITSNDVIRSLQSSVYNKVVDNRELVSILPIKYLIDDQTVVENPVGKHAEKLKVKAVAVTVPKKNSQAIVTVLEQIGIDVVDLTISSIADYYEFKDNWLDSNIGAIVNIGANVTNVAVFNKGIITSCEVIDIGGDNIDYDLSYVYKISRQDAIYLKETVAVADKNMALPSEAITLTNKGGETIKVNQYDASEIVSSRLEEILNLVKKQINLLTKKEISYIIVTGGVSETGEFKNMLDYTVSKSSIGSVNEIGARHNKYATALGLVKYYDSRLRLRNRDFSIFTIEEQEELSGMNKKVNFSENSVLGKLFKYFFDN